jgi:hypothetical protein
MANTLIQIKSSTSNASPTILDVAEPAYSYVSNTLFIGTAGGTGVLPVGGKFYVDQQQIIFNTVNAAFTAANTGGDAAAAGSYANSAFAVANSAALYANAAFLAANNASDSWVRNQANAAFIAANTKLSSSGGTITGPISGLGNSKLDFTTFGSNTVYLTTTNDDSTALFMGAVSADLYANTSVSIRANTGGTSQTWTFDTDGSLTLPANGTIIGLQTIQGGTF